VISYNRNSTQATESVKAISIQLRKWNGHDVDGDSKGVVRLVDREKASGSL